MKPNVKVYRMLLLSAAISMPAWLSGCASSGADATVKKAEKLVATHPVKMVKQAPAKSRLRPTGTRTIPSRLPLSERPGLSIPSDFVDGRITT